MKQSRFSTAALRALGSTGLSVPAITVGTARWRDGNERCASRRESDELLEAIASSGRPFVLDTASSYGESEARIGDFFGGDYPPNVLVQTKADRDFRTGDFSGAQMLRSLERSCALLRLDRLPMVYLHDPENTTWDASMAPGGPVATLVRAREEGLIAHLGLSGGPVDMMVRYLESGLFEAAITHMRWTLVDRSAEKLLAAARAQGHGLMNAAPYGGGILASPTTVTRYAYGEARPATRRAVDRIAEACERAGVPIAALALQFSLRDTRVDSTIVGVLNRRELDETLRLASLAIPSELWAVVEAELPPSSTWEG